MKVITLARKPLDGTVAHNMFTHGCGGLNIKVCRVRLNGDEKLPERKAGYNDSLVYGGGEEGFRYTPSTNGRWPANLILQHLDGCRCDGVKRVRGHKGYPNGPGGIWKKEYQQNNQDAVGYTQCSTAADNEPWKGHADADGKESVTNWLCVEGCPVKALDTQSLAGGMHSAGSSRKASRSAGKTGMFPMDGDGHRFGDIGGASRFFKQVVR